MHVQPAPGEALMDLRQGLPHLRAIQLRGEEEDELVRLAALVGRLLHRVPTGLSTGSEP
jgi:hypothetical protein